MYRNIFYVILVSWSLTSCKNNITGVYRENDLGSYFIDLKKDSSYRYRYSYDTYHKFSYGIWEIRKDTLFLKPKILYDTVRLKHKDSLIISLDEKPDLILQKDNLNYKSVFYSISMDNNMLLHAQKFQLENTIKLISKRRRLFPINRTNKKNRKDYFYRINKD
jgi:hypothetical protein